MCVFYLVLRALDTGERLRAANLPTRHPAQDPASPTPCVSAVEDDMSIPKRTKVPMLLDFHKKIYDPDFTFPCGTKHYKVGCLLLAVAAAHVRLLRRSVLLIGE